jgi:radical SAM protein with 4Fe4S-binding SPASM domain
MVINKYNDHEVEQARAMAEELGMTFEAVTIWTPEDRKEDWLPHVKDGDSWRNLVGGPPKCHHLWQDVSVNFNGDLHPCCAEFAPSDRVVNLLEQPFKGVWNGEGYRSRRRINKTGPVDCSTCHGDTETNWYKMWVTGNKAESSAEPSDPRPPRDRAEPVEKR